MATRVSPKAQRIKDLTKELKALGGSIPKSLKSSIMALRKAIVVAKKANRVAKKAAAGVPKKVTKAIDMVPTTLKERKEIVAARKAEDSSYEDSDPESDGYSSSEDECDNDTLWFKYDAEAKKYWAQIKNYPKTLGKIAAQRAFARQGKIYMQLFERDMKATNNYEELEKINAKTQLESYDIWVNTEKKGKHQMYAKYERLLHWYRQATAQRDLLRIPLPPRR